MEVDEGEIGWKRSRKKHRTDFDFCSVDKEGRDEIGGEGRRMEGGANYLLNEKVTDSSLELEELVERWSGPRRGWRISSGGGGLGEGGLATSTSRRAK